MARFAQDRSLRANPWVKVEPQPKNADDGVDFELQARTDFPFLVSADRPWSITSSIGEGRP